jgi:hypothetical protein
MAELVSPEEVAVHGLRRSWVLSVLLAKHARKHMAARHWPKYIASSNRVGPQAPANILFKRVARKILRQR